MGGDPRGRPVALGELSTFELLLYVTMGDLVQQGVTQQDYSLTGAGLAVGTFALLTVALSWGQGRFPRSRGVVTGRPVLVMEHGRPVEATMSSERVELADLLVSAREQGIRELATVEYAVLEADGRVSFFVERGETRGETGTDDSGAPEKPPGG